jgi:hypothetical protein
MLELQSIGEDNGEESMEKRYMEAAAGRREVIGEGARGRRGDRPNKEGELAASFLFAVFGSCISQLEAHPA